MSEPVPGRAGLHRGRVTDLRYLLDWQRIVLRATTPGLVYRLAAWRPTHGGAGGRLSFVEDGPGSTRLRWSGPEGDDLVKVSRRRAWMLDVVARCGGTRATLREVRRVADGETTYEYAVYWTERARVARAVVPGLVAAIALSTISLAIGGVPPAAWLLVPLAAVAAYALSRQRVVRGNRIADAECSVAFRWLLARALAVRPEPKPEPDLVEAPPAEALRPGYVVLEKDGEFWRVGYGGTTVMLRHSRGLALLVHLVRSPRRDIHVSELDSITPSGAFAAARESPVPERDMMPVVGDAGELIDRRALDEYRRRVAELRAELEDAEERHDLGRSEMIRAELEPLMDELRTAVASRGRVRRASADVERLRVSITRRIRSAIAQIAKHHPALGAHLAATISTGYYCSYDPSAAGADSSPRER